MMCNKPRHTTKFLPHLKCGMRFIDFPPLGRLMLATVATIQLQFYKLTSWKVRGFLALEKTADAPAVSGRRWEASKGCQPDG